MTLCADIGYKSINHAGEQLCGDHVDIVEQDDNSTVIVLADGLGSGVKASILSTLTIENNFHNDGRGAHRLEDCVETIATDAADMLCPRCRLLNLHDHAPRE